MKVKIQRVVSTLLIIAVLSSLFIVSASAASTGNDVVSLMGAVEWNWRAYTGSTTYDSGSFYYGTIAKQSKGSKLAISCTLPDAISLIGGYDEIEVIIESSAASLPSMYINDTLTTYTKVGSRFYYSCSRSDLHATTMKLEFASMPSAYVQILDCRLSGSESCLNIGIYRGTSLSGDSFVSGPLFLGDGDNFFCFQARGDSFHFTVTSPYYPVGHDPKDFYFSFSCTAEVFDDGQFRDLPVYQISYDSGVGDYLDYNLVIDLTDAPDDSKVVVHISSYVDIEVDDWYIRFNNTLDDSRFFWVSWMQRISALLSGLQSSIDETAPQDVQDAQQSVDDKIDSMSDFEQGQYDSIDNGVSDIQTFVVGDVGKFSKSLAFVQKYTGRIANGIQDYLIVFTLPIFIGIFLYLCSRTPGAIRAFRDRRPKD